MRYSIILAVAALVACGVDRDRPGTSIAGTEALPLPFPLTAEQTNGRIVFDSVCGGCHGVAGRGDGTAIPEGAQPPPDLTADTYSRVTARQLRERFLAGQGRSHDEDLRMFLGANELAEVLSYVTVLSRPPGVPGSALNGRELYRRYCISCHGVAGDGNGPAAGLLVTSPTDFSRDTLVARRDFEGLIRRARSGPDGAHASSMPAWGFFFDDRMLWDVVTYLPVFQRPLPSSRPAN